jgi:hypothetical protein
LQELDFGSDHPFHTLEMLNWLLSYDRIPPIRRLKLEFTIKKAALCAIGGLLRALGPTLEHLTFDNIIDYTQSMSFMVEMHLFRL